MGVIHKVLEFEILSIGDFTISIFNLISLLIIAVITTVFLKIIKKALFRKSNVGAFDTGTTHALYQIIKYAVWIFSIGLMFEAIGVKFTILLAGSAALLVGVGLGLQQTFNDIISGVILLSERSIKVEDVLEIDGDVVKIQSIGLRTSRALNRDEISIIIPNSLITTSKVINWSHQTKNTRFRIEVGVAYGSDVDSVIKILEESAIEHPEIDANKNIEGRLLNFGNSSLDFELLFYSDNIFRIGKTKSDIRRNIERNFRSSNISIPFPQVDLHVKSNENIS